MIPLLFYQTYQIAFLQCMAFVISFETFDKFLKRRFIPDDESCSFHCGKSVNIRLYCCRWVRWDLFNQFPYLFKLFEVTNDNWIVHIDRPVFKLSSFFPLPWFPKVPLCQKSDDWSFSALSFKIVSSNLKWANSLVASIDYFFAKIVH